MTEAGASEMQSRVFSRRGSLKRYDSVLAVVATFAVFLI